MNRFVLVLVVLVLESKPPNRGRGRERRRGRKGGSWKERERCRVLGRVTMDQTIVDVSRVPGTRAGDEAVLIGRQDRDEVSAADLATWCGTVPWEVLTTISGRVPRIYRGGQAA